MALIGLKNLVFAPIATYNEGSAITYTVGSALTKVGHGISANVTLNRRDNPLYADNTKVENDKGITDYSIELSVDDIIDSVRETLLGETKISETVGSDTVDVYRIEDGNPPYVGFGYLTNRICNGVNKVTGYWFHRTQWAMNNETANTKRENVEWGTPTLSGTGLGAIIDSSNKTVLYDHADFTTESAAVAWLNKKAGIQ